MRLTDDQNQTIFYKMMYDIEKSKNRKLIIALISIAVISALGFLFYCL